MADFGGFFKNRVRKIAYANRVAYAKSSRAGRDLRTRFSICVRDFCWDFTECDLRTLGAICVRDLRTRFAYATRFCVRDLRTRRDFSRTANFWTKLGAIYVRDLRTRFAYATRFCVRDLRTRRDFSRLRESRTQPVFAYAKRRTTSAPKSRTQTFLNAMPAGLLIVRRWTDGRTDFLSFKIYILMTHTIHYIGSV